MQPASRTCAYVPGIGFTNEPIWSLRNDIPLPKAKEAQANVKDVADMKGAAAQATKSLDNLKGFDLTRNEAQKVDLGSFSKPHGSDFWNIPAVVTGANNRNSTGMWTSADFKKAVAAAPPPPDRPGPRELGVRLLADQELYGKVTPEEAARMRREWDPRISDGS